MYLEVRGILSTPIAFLVADNVQRAPCLVQREYILLRMAVFIVSKFLFSIVRFS